MKHYSAQALARSAAIARDPLMTEADVTAMLRAQLDGRRGENGRLADRLGITRVELSQILHGHSPLRSGVAERLGFRKVVRFEPIE